MIETELIDLFSEPNALLKAKLVELRSTLVKVLFASRDRNEMFDPIPADFDEGIKDELTRLHDRLKRFIPLDSPLQILLRD